MSGGAGIPKTEGKDAPAGTEIHRLYQEYIAPGTGEFPRGRCFLSVFHLPKEEKMTILCGYLSEPNRPGQKEKEDEDHGSCIQFLSRTFPADRKSVV